MLSYALAGKMADEVERLYPSRPTAPAVTTAPVDVKEAVPAPQANGTATA
jgi:hypothetical protein